jgi:hypothetical protein
MKKYDTPVKWAILCILLGIIGYFYFYNSFGVAAVAEQELRHEIDAESHGQIQLVSFRKTDGEKSDGMYELDYEAEITFKADGIWMARDVMNYSHNGLTFSFSQAQPSNVFDQLNNNMSGGSRVHIGNRVKISGAMLGEKKESGWKFQSGDSQVVSGLPAN